MRRFSSLLLVVFCLGLCTHGVPALAGSGDLVIEDFDGRSVPKTIEATDADVSITKLPDAEGRALKVEFQKAARPGIMLNAPEGQWDWGEFAGVTADLVNPGSEPVRVFMRLDTVGEDGRGQSNRFDMVIPARERRPFPFFFKNLGAGPYWGMRGVPELGPVITIAPGLAGFGGGSSRAKALRLYLNRPEQEHTLLVNSIQVFKEGSPLERTAPFPFVDRLGQYMHAEWPGKIRDEAGLRAQREREEPELLAHPQLAGRDPFGGWAEGPQLDATGWFRTEKVNGKWWFVTPDGHLFFSLGVDCVHAGDSTWITGRDTWFEWLPEPDGPFKEFVHPRSGVHSMAEPIGGSGTTACIYGINLKRKYGEDWRKAHHESVYRRLPAWGFNTLGNWTDGEIRRNSPIPFVVAGRSSRSRVIEASEGFWRRMVDVFAPTFAPETEADVAKLVEPFKDNPLVLGYFIDNEESWKGIPRAVMTSPVEQSARKVFVEDLKAKYDTIEAVNAAWETDAADWDELRVPKRPAPACVEDSDAFEYKFGRRYFETVKEALRKCAPNQLYLGCRFTLMYCPEPVLRACAEVSDVISINGYTPEIAPDMYAEYDRPVVIGEFHFGALDRGMFHTGLRATANQQERAEAYTRYVESVAANPCFVGCHWFQYSDQPLTGRSYDGENYGIGFVSIVDVPYKEMVEAAKQVHEELYTFRNAR